MPLSSRRAVLTLLLKKGDLTTLKNWRPVSLLTVDYKLVAKVMANRLEQCLASIVYNDQSYCIPGRSIFDNLFLMRDVLELCKPGTLRFGVFSLDQEKAFDRVSHEYLFEVLNVFGFGRNCINIFRMLYNNVSCLLKVGGGLSRPVQVKRGIRQGCPLSGQLYSLAIEPMLCLLRTKLQGLTLSAAGLSNPVYLSAYADDLNIFIRNEEDVRHTLSHTHTHTFAC
ncbi:hypothetical protein LDENG_00252430 [Lucifuga dentata]|nr:hypothetical protein LDENG_00252430 [Lucifuga dentata]